MLHDGARDGNKPTNVAAGDRADQASQDAAAAANASREAAMSLVGRVGQIACKLKTTMFSSVPGCLGSPSIHSA